MTFGNSDGVFFKLPIDFIDKYRGKQPQWGILGQITYKRTYARRVEDENRTEEFYETLERVVNGCYTIQKRHCLGLNLDWIEEKAIESAKEMYSKMWNFKFLPPGRGLWMMGTDYIDKHGSMALNNCAFTSTDDINNRFATSFVWAMDCLMLGVGVGFDTTGAGKITIKKPKRVGKYIIEDSRKGWITTLELLLNGYFKGENIPEFDFSLVRPAGLPIKGFGGTSSGPEPLKKMLKDIDNLLSDKINMCLSSCDIVDIFNFIGCCVVSGNVRRSAQCALGSIDDDEFINLKQDKDKVNDHRWASNNSIIAKQGMNYNKITDKITLNGEPGIFWLDNARNYSRMIDPADYKDKMSKGTNPCFEVQLESFELCCLCETFPSMHNSYEEYERTLKYAYLYAKTVTLINTEWAITNAVMLKNRRLGISQSGIIDAIVKLGRNTVKEWCIKGYEYLQRLDEIYSNWLCVPKSKKLTCVKPSGSISLLAGVSPGIHYPHSEYYIRRILIAKNSDLVNKLQNAGYTYHEVGNSYSFEFPMMEKHFDRSKFDVTIWEQFENAAFYQKYWADNQVSITVTFKPEEVKDIVRCLETFEDRLKGVSLLPLDTKFYENAPYEAITKEKYEEMVSNLKDVDLNTNEQAAGEMYCTNDHCEIKLHTYKIKAMPMDVKLKLDTYETNVVDKEVKL